MTQMHTQITVLVARNFETAIHGEGKCSSCNGSGACSGIHCGTESIAAGGKATYFRRTTSCNCAAITSRSRHTLRCMIFNVGCELYTCTVWLVWRSAFLIHSVENTKHDFLNCNLNEHWVIASLSVTHLPREYAFQLRRPFLWHTNHSDHNGCTHL